MNRTLRLGARWRHVVVAVLSACAFAVTYIAGVLTTVGQHTEGDILAASRFTYEQTILNLVTVPNLLIACVIVAVIGLLRRRVSAAIAGVAIIGVSSLLTQVLKHGLLDRPALASMGDNTFPSGHMTAFAAVTFALLLVVTSRIRTAVAIVGSLALSVVGILLLRLGWHRPSDVLGAILLVCCVSALAQLAVAAERPVRLPPVVERVLAGLSVAAAVVTAVSYVLYTESPWLGMPDSLMLTAQSATVAAVLLTMAANLWLLRHNSGVGPTGQPPTSPARYRST